MDDLKFISLHIYVLFKKTSVHFTNNGTSAVPWEVVHEQTKLIPAMKYSMNDAIYADSSMITVFPDQGCLLPGCTQTVDILFSPSVAQHEVISSFLLKSGDYSSQNISIRGVGASTNLTIDKEQLSFGILRVGSFKETKIRMINCGILTSRYFLECEGLVFTADPEQGMLDGDGFVDITVKFYPKKDGRFTGMITITSLLEQGAYSDPLYITMDGEGSYPELSIPTKVVDYGTALFGTANIKEITIENKGSAEANILFSTTCPSLTLDYNMEEPIPPYSTKQVTLVYYPNEIETLEAKVYLRSTDSRSDYFMIQVKGTVGLPKLVITPSHFFDELHFGVCPTHKKHERIVTLLNDGNIPLSLAFQVELLKRTPVEGSDDIQEPKSMVLSENALWVEPSTGHISMGEIATFKVIFCPTHIADYEFKLTLRYDFKFIAAVFKGTGGRAILKVDTPLSYIDFGICRLGRVFKKVFTITNTGNLGVDFKLRPEPRGKDWSAYNDEIGFGDDRKSLIKTPGGGIVMLSSEEKAALISSSTGQPDASVLSESLNQKFIIAQEEPDWVRELSNFGFKFPRPNSHCAAYSKVDFVVEFCPHSESSVSIKVRMFIDGCSPEDVEIRGRAAKPKLTVYQGSAFQKLTGGGGSSSGKTGTDPIAGMGAKLKKHEIPSIDLGVHPVDSDSMSSIQLVNSGPFGCDFMIQPFSLREFEVYPARGYIEPDSNMPLKIYFRPSAESRYQTIMRILWEESPILLQISASGGIGKLEVAYLEEKDKAMEGLDFGMVPFNTETDKRCFIYNVGMVPVNISSAVDNQEFSVAYMAEPAEWKGLSAAKAAMVKKRGIAWAPKAKTKLLPGRYIELAVRFWTITTNTSSGNVIVRSEGNEFPIPLRGKGGTIQISHRGDLSLGDIASSFTYKRKITLINSGSISTTLNMEWMIVGHSGESGAATVKLIETYSVIDPRSGFARQQFFKDKGLNPDGSGGVGAGHSLYALTARDRWRLIQRLILKKTDKKDDMSASTYGTRSRSSSSGNNNSNNGDSSGSDLHQELSGGERRQSRLASGNASSLALGSSIKKGLVGQGSAFFKRRQMFYHLISTIPVSSQSVSTTRPFISVDPPSCTLPSYGDVTIMVEVNLSTEDTFLATLLIKPAIVSMPSYEIPLTATPKAVNIVCDDTRIINFYRQPIGQAETLERTFTNIGKKDILFLFKNPNQSLAINPDRGLLEVGKSLKVEFIFTPTEETPQKSDIIFEPNCSQPIRLKLFGGGGYVKCSLARYRRFDFGHCMIAKDTVSLLPVANEGSAILHLTRFELTESDAFFKGTEWPESR